MPITIGALRESAPGETRVSLVPEVVDKFVAAGARVVLRARRRHARSVSRCPLQEGRMGWVVRLPSCLRPTCC